MNDSSPAASLPVYVLTGFLGSGKTTLLNRLITEYPDSAIIINELGDIGIDDQLVSRNGMPVQLMAGGCICCTMSAELPLTLRNILLSRQAGTLPAFRRIIIETTGAADPTHLASLVSADRYLQRHCRLESIITTVDGLYGVQHLEQFPETSDQIMAADVIMVSKTDIASEETIAGVEALVSRLNASAPRYRIAKGLPPAGLLEHLTPSHCRITGTSATRQEQFLERLENTPRAQSLFMPPATLQAPPAYSSGIQAASLRLPDALDEDQLMQALGQLFIACGVCLLRFKGIFKLNNHDNPMTLNYCQQRLELPDFLPAWPSADHDSRMVLIVKHDDDDFARRQLARLGQSLDAMAGTRPTPEETCP